MKKGNFALIVIASIFNILALSCPARAAWLYEMTILGSFEGGSSFGTALNDSGQVVGGVQIENGRNQGFVWDRSQGMRIISGYPSDTEIYYSVASDINNNGYIVGNYSNRVGYSSFYIPADGVPQRYNYYHHSEIYTINENGLIGGKHIDDTEIFQPFIYDINQQLHLSLYYDFYQDSHGAIGMGKVTSINNLADSIVSYDYNTFLVERSGGVVRLSDMIEGTPYIYGADINAKKTIVGKAYLGFDGSYGDIYNRFDAFVWNIEDGLQLLKGRSSSTFTSSANAINEFGLVVGNAVWSNQGQHGFIWDNEEGMLDLNYYVLDRPLNFNISDAIDINESGVILATATFGGIQRAVLLTPTQETPVITPEPTTLILFVLGLLCVLILKRYRAAVL